MQANTAHPFWRFGLNDKQSTLRDCTVMGGGETMLTFRPQPPSDTAGHDHSSFVGKSLAGLHCIPRIDLFLIPLPPAPRSFP